MKKFFALMAFSGFALFSSQPSIFAQDQSATPENADIKATVSPPVVNQQIGEWGIRCVYPNNTVAGQEKIKKECVAQQNLTIIDKKSNKTVPVVSIVLEQGAKNNGKTPPTQFSLVAPAGFSLTKPVELNANKQQVPLPWAVCNGNKCVASAPLNASFKAALEKNEGTFFVFHRINGTTLTINFKMNNLTEVLAKMDELANKATP